MSLLLQRRPSEESGIWRSLSIARIGLFVGCAVMVLLYRPVGNPGRGERLLLVAPVIGFLGVNLALLYRSWFLRKGGRWLWPKRLVWYAAVLALFLLTRAMFILM